jgi:ubiquinone/menaquinone biosynthesis C-methylase UbiE
VGHETYHDLYKILDFVPPPLKKILELIKPSDVILDAGAGDLIYTKYLMNMGYSVIPVDILVPKDAENIPFIQASVDNLPFKDNTFDFAFCFSTIEFVEKDQKAIDEFYRVLKKDSFLVITVPSSISIYKLLIDFENLLKINAYTNRLQIQYPEYNQKIHYYTNKQIKSILNRFKIEQLYGYNLNFIPRLLSIFYKVIFGKNSRPNSIVKMSTSLYNREDNNTYKNWFLTEFCYHKIIVCKK